MNILSVVDLPGVLWESLRQQYPDIVCRTELKAAELSSRVDWPEIVFGNVPVEWAIEAAQNGRLRWLQSVSAGVEAYAPLRNTSVRLTSARGLHHRTLAHHVLLMILALSRNLPAHVHNQQAQIWHRDPNLIQPLRGQLVGALGYGGIGRHLAHILHALEMRVVGISPSCADSRTEAGAEVWPMDRGDELIELADHLVLCLPLMPSTIRFMNADRFAHMPVGARFYNIARGQLVEEQALVRALQNGHLAGAALDVFEEEPLPPGHPLWSMPHVIVTPHIAGHYKGLREASFQLFRENLARYLQGQALVNEVNFAGQQGIQPHRAKSQHAK